MLPTPWKKRPAILNRRDYKILVACEFSGTVRAAFRARGFDAWSCDLLPADDNDPHHIQTDALTLLGNGWHLLIAHPPCTDLAVSGARYFAQKRADGRQARALEFFRALADAPIKRRAIENPIGICSTQYRKPEQIIHPWQFGHAESKTTCLWLAGLPPLMPTKIMQQPYRCPCGHSFEAALGKYGCPNCAGENVAAPCWENQTPSGQNKLPPSPDRWKLRAKTYQGIAEAMAQQWGEVLEQAAP